MKELPYSYDLLYDIKNEEQLKNEVEYLVNRLKGLADLCRRDGNSIDTYVRSVITDDEGEP